MLDVTDSLDGVMDARPNATTLVPLGVWEAVAACELDAMEAPRAARTALLEGIEYCRG